MYVLEITFYKKENWTKITRIKYPKKYYRKIEALWTLYGPLF